MAIVNPRQARDFARSTGQLSKTDAIDARGLALFAARVRPEVRALATEEARTLEALVSRRRQIVGMLTQEKNRLGSAGKAVAKGIKKHIRWLERQLKEVDGELDERIRRSPVWAAKRDLLQSVPGVGPNLARTRRFRGKRMLWGGRATVRTALYMSVWSATRWNPAVRLFYTRLRAQGKSAKVAQAACMRKLLTMLNAMIRDHRAWDASIPLEQLRLQHSCLLRRFSLRPPLQIQLTLRFRAVPQIEIDQGLVGDPRLLRELLEILNRGVVKADGHATLQPLRVRVLLSL